MKPRTLSKREFVRCSLFGACGLIAGAHQLASFVEFFGGEGRGGISRDELWKWSKEALFYTATPRGLKCLKCPNACVLEEGQTGQCRNRVNYKGKMYSIAYGNPCAVHIDPIEKKPFFHFLPSTRAFSIATAGCNLACLNCQNWDISQMSPKETENYDLMPASVVEECLNSRCESIAYTYAEPNTFYEYAYDTAKLARAKHIKNVWKSSGYINEEPLRMVCKVLDAANIDLKSFDDDIYVKLNGGRLAPVLRTLKVFHEEHVWLEITNLVIPSWTDNLEMIRKMCEWLVENGLRDRPLHFSRFNPLYKLYQLPMTPVSILEQAREIAVKAGIRYAYIGNVPGHWAEHTYCHKCGKMIIERRGFQILSNHLENGKCKFCSEPIPGVWSS
jgi:pyruvate formate lyase activating enzyme